MAATINIIIKGVAICYQKPVGPKKVWKVLFPFDPDCHRVFFSIKEEDDPEPQRVPMGFPRGTMKVFGTKASSTTSESSNFTASVLDLTDPNTNGRKTHKALEPQSTLDDSTFILEIEDAKFFVHNYLQDLTDDEVVLYEEDKNGTQVSRQFPGQIAHSVRAEIDLFDDQQQLKIKRGALPEESFGKGKSYTLLFDNDCKGRTKGKNDIDMLYDKTFFDPDSQPAKFKRRFRIGGKSTVDISVADLAEPPDLDLAEGKPCLVVKAKEPGNLP